MKSLKEMEERKKQPAIPKPTFSDLFKTKKLAVTTLLSLSLWLACGFCYFGINQYVSVLGSNIYIDVLITGLIQVSII